MAPATPSKARRNGLAPWTVITQGSSLTYDDATILDQLEYVVRAAPTPAAVARTLAQKDFAANVVRTLAKVVGHVSKADVLLRASDLLIAVIDYVVSPAGGDAAMRDVSAAMGPEYVTPFLAYLSGDREVASHFALALGTLLGSKNAEAIAIESGSPAHRVAQCIEDYVSSVSKMLADVADDAGDEQPAGELMGSTAPGSSMAAVSTGGEIASPVKPLGSTLSALAPGTSHTSIAAPGSSEAEALLAQSSSGVTSSIDRAPSSAAGYVPTVSGIAGGILLGSAAMMTANDEHLGRLLSGLSAFLARDANRVKFCKTIVPAGASGPSVLTALLDRDVNLPIQATYQTVFCLWLLSFSKRLPGLPEDLKASKGSEETPGEEDEELKGSGDLSDSAVIAGAMEDAGTPLRLTAILREVQAEKVVRISLATLRNLMLMSTKLRKEMVSARLVPALESLCFRRWNDEDINEDLRVLADALASELESMTTFDVYRHEVLSGALEWTPAHRDETFWRENVEKLEINNQEVLRCMVRLLNESTDPTVLSVACHDLAQFVKYHPRGRSIAQSLGVKGRLMELMADGESEVRRYALTTVQVLLISKWNLMDRVG